MKALVLFMILLFPSVGLADTLPAPKLELVSAGKGKPQQLRFAPTKGAKHTLVISTQASKARGNKRKLADAEWTPTIRTTMTIEIKDVTKDGDVHIAFAYQNIEVISDKRVWPVTMKAYEAGMKPLVGMKGTAIITTLGVTKQVDFDVPADASDEARAAYAMMRNVATQIAQPLPEQAVGVGAKWKTAASQTVGEITANTTATYQLQAVTGTQAKIKIDVLVKGKGSGEGTLTVTAKGGGVTTLDLASIIASRSDISLRTETNLDVDDMQLRQVDTSKTTAVAQASP